MFRRGLNKLSKFKTIFRVGFFLAVRELKRANIWTTALIVAVMVLTFLNLIVVSGILVGLIQGSEQAYTQRYLGDVVLDTLSSKTYIQNSQDIISFIKSLPEVAVVSPRYTAGVQIEANYKTRTRLTDKVDATAGAMMGIDPVTEDSLSHLSKYVINGHYLQPDDYDQILVGANLLYNYTPIDSSALVVLKNVDVGSTVRLIINGITREVKIKGVVKTKVSELDQGIFMNDSEFRILANRYDLNVGQIAIKLKPGSNPQAVKDAIIRSGADQYAKVELAIEAEPKFVQDIKATFAMLGNLIGSVGLAVASITIFIVIFVNAITRRRYIGILKGIGIDAFAIEISYILQSLFYAIIGMVIGSLIIFLILQPYIAAHPINFPFSDGILVATASDTAIRALILFIATMIAGYIPARIVVKQNTLNAILGR